jgi:hypothetical protein
MDPVARAGLRLDVDDNIHDLMAEIQQFFHARRDAAKLGAAGRLSAERTAQIVVLGSLFALEMSDPVCQNPNIKRAIEKKVMEVCQHVKVSKRTEGGGGSLIKDRSGHG